MSTVTYNSYPDGLLTYTSPSPKLCLGPSGTYRYGPHNLYVNSATPANQSITVVSGASYSVTITGSVSVTASGAATGTWTAGTNTFTAATGTLTLGSTSGAGTVHVRRTPSDSTYLATTSSARYGLPYEWDTSGVLQGIRVEDVRTNLFLNSRSAATQTVTVTNATSYTVSFFGTGSITFSGANSSTLNGTGASDRVSATFTTGSTSLTCTVSGSIDLVQVEAGTFATSPIETFGATVTRAADNISLATSAFPWSTSAGTVFAEVVTPSVITNSPYAWSISDGTADNRLLVVFGSSYIIRAVTGGVDQYSLSPGSTSPLASLSKTAFAFANDDMQAVISGTAQSVDNSGTMPNVNSLKIGESMFGTSQLSGYIRRLLYVPRRMSQAEMITLTT